MAENTESDGRMRANAGDAGYIRLGKNILEVKGGVRAIRTLRASLLSLAYALGGSAKREAYLVLVNPGISEERLRAEWEAALLALSGPVRKRLHLITVRAGRFVGLPDAPPKMIQEYVSDLIDREYRPGTILRRPDYFFVVLTILVNQWLRKGGPVSTRWLMETAGCSYPTASKALKRLGRAVKRHPYRRVELDRFPKDAWKQLLAVSDDVRQTTRFIDQSGQPRSPEVLLSRFRNLRRPEVAVGGSLGARRWQPNLDLVGNPRLDLSIHCPGNRLDLGFVRKLDPALAPAETTFEQATLVVHVVRQAVPTFQLGPDGVNWASPVECLLDLHEMRLEPQALEFVNVFAEARVDG